MVDPLEVECYGSLHFAAADDVRKEDRPEIECTIKQYKHMVIKYHAKDRVNADLQRNRHHA